MISHDSEIIYALRCVIITDHCLYGSNFEKIETKTKVKKLIAKNIYKRVRFRAENDNFNDLFQNCENVKRTERSTRVKNDSVTSTEIKKIMLKHSNMQSYIAVMNQKNVDILDKKKFSRFLIERIQHEHQHLDEKNHEVNELMRERIAKKLRIDVEHDKQKEFLRLMYKENRRKSRFHLYKRNFS